MSETFKVMRPHLGDKMYNVGDERTADRATVKHLIDKGVLVDAAKSDGEAKDKAEAKPKNKAGE